MEVLNWIDRWKEKVFLQIFTIYLRYLIGGAFIMAAFGMGKLDGSSNLINSMDSPIQDLQPIQQFFRVMSDSGLYWKFIGWSQIIAGVLLMSQRFAKLGAAIFFGLILNIFIITISYDFKGTPVVTGLMLLATTYLIIWDIRSFLIFFMDEPPLKKLILPVFDHAFWKGLSVVMMISIIIGAMVRINFILQLAVPFAEGLAAFILFFTIVRKKTNSISSR